VNPPRDPELDHDRLGLAPDNRTQFVSPAMEGREHTRPGQNPTPRVNFCWSSPPGAFAPAPDFTATVCWFAAGGLARKGGSAREAGAAID